MKTKKIIKPIPYVNHLQILLRDLAKDPNLFFLENKGVYTHSYIPSALNVNMEDDDSEEIYFEREYIILKFHRNYEPFWFKIELELDKMKFKQCKIKVFTGNENKELLFSADWMNNELKHAQPHWHFDYQMSKDNIKFIKSDEVLEFNEPQEFEPESLGLKKFNITLEKIRDFHFAMNADWHKNNQNYSRNIETPEQLQNWVKNTVDYIKNQLDWIIG